MFSHGQCMSSFKHINGLIAMICAELQVRHGWIKQDYLALCLSSYSATLSISENACPSVDTFDERPCSARPPPLPLEMPCEANKRTLRLASVDRNDVCGCPSTDSVLFRWTLGSPTSFC